MINTYSITLHNNKTDHDITRVFNEDLFDNDEALVEHLKSMKETIDKDFTKEPF